MSMSPLTDAEIRDLLSQTLHGPLLHAPLPHVTMQRVFATLAEVPELRAANWRPIETAPKGVHGYAWMFLAWGEADDRCTGSGFRYGDEFYVAATFYRGGPTTQRQYEIRQTTIVPTHWMPLPEPPR